MRYCAFGISVALLAILALLLKTEAVFSHFDISNTPSSLILQLPLRGNVEVKGYLPGDGDHARQDYWAVDLFSNNAAVYPITSGKVVYAEYNCDKAETPSETPCDEVAEPFYGYTVAIDHGNGIYSIYTHLASSGLPWVNQTVSYDTQIGTMSDSGCSICGVHLHFAVHQGPENLTGRDALWGSNIAVNVWDPNNSWWIPGLPWPPSLGPIQSLTKNYAYIAYGTAGLQIVDVSNPSSPRELGDYDTSGFTSNVHVAGNYAYVADESGGLRVVDVSNPTEPREVGSVDTPSDGVYAVDVYKSADEVYVVINPGVYPEGKVGGLQVVNVSNPTTPVELGFYETQGWPEDVHVAGNYAYVADHHEGLIVLDVSNPAGPIQVGQYKPEGDVTINIRGVHVVGRYAYVAAGWYGGLRVVDVANPQAPQEVGVSDTPGMAYDLFVAGDYAYVADGQSGGLRIVDISSPFSPQEVGFYDTPGVAVDIFVNEHHAFVADDNAGLRVIDISDPNSPHEVGFFDSDMAGNAKGVTLASESLSDTEEPFVNWIAPVGNGGVYPVGGETTVQLEVSASDDVAVSRVSFWRWDTVNQQVVEIGNDDTAPYQMNLDTGTLNYEWNQIYAQAYDTTANESERKWIWLYRDSPGCIPEPGGIVLFEHTYWTGRCYVFTEDHPDFNLINFNDIASSIRFEGSYVGQYQVTAYEHPHYGGSFYTFTEDHPDFNLINFNDIASSVVISSLTACDTFEPDDSYYQANWIQVNSEGQTHHICKAGDQDWVEFNVSAGTEYTIQIYNLGPASDTYLFLYGTDGITELAQDDDGGTESLASMIVWTASQSGTYYAMVRQFDQYEFGPNTNYDISIRASLSLVHFGQITISADNIYDLGGGRYRAVDHVRLGNELGTDFFLNLGLGSEVEVDTSTLSVLNSDPGSDISLLGNDGDYQIESFSNLQLFPNEGRISYEGRIGWRPGGTADGYLEGSTTLDMLTGRLSGEFVAQDSVLGFLAQGSVVWELRTLTQFPIEFWVKATQSLPLGAYIEARGGYWVRINPDVGLYQLGFDSPTAGIYITGVEVEQTPWPVRIGPVEIERAEVTLNTRDTTLIFQGEFLISFMSDVGQSQSDSEKTTAAAPIITRLQIRPNGTLNWNTMELNARAYLDLNLLFVVNLQVAEAEIELEWPDRFVFRESVGVRVDDLFVINAQQGNLSLDLRTQKFSIQGRLGIDASANRNLVGQLGVEGSFEVNLTGTPTLRGTLDGEANLHGFELYLSHGRFELTGLDQVEIELDMELIGVLHSNAITTWYHDRVEGRFTQEATIGWITIPALENSFIWTDEKLAVSTVVLGTAPVTVSIYSDGRWTVDFEGIAAALGSPVELHLYDALGRHVGPNPVGGVDVQVPGARYLRLPQTDQQVIFLPTYEPATDYRFVIRGIGDGTFHLELMIHERSLGRVAGAEYVSVPITPHTEAVVSVQEGSSYNLGIDTDGDGNFDSERPPDTLENAPAEDSGPPLLSNTRMTVSYQGRGSAPSNRWVDQIEVAVYANGEDVATLSLSTTTDEEGGIDVVGIPAETYGITVKGLHSLRNRKSDVTIEPTSNSVYMGVLLEGDANDDNCINAPDFSILRTAFGQSHGQPGYDSRADFNWDGAVNAPDFSLLCTNFGRCGDVLVTD